MVEVCSTQKFPVAEVLAISVVSLPFVFYCKRKKDGAEICSLSFLREKMGACQWPLGRLEFADSCTDFELFWKIFML